MEWMKIFSRQVFPWVFARFPVGDRVRWPRFGSGRALLLATAGGLAMTLWACRSPRPAPSAATLAAAARILQGRAEFAGGAVVADFVLAPIQAGAPEGVRAGAPGGGLGPGPGGPGPQGMPPGGGYGSPPAYGEDNRVAGVGLRAGTAPRQSLRLVLCNQSARDVAVNVIEVRVGAVSFAPKPERVLLAPGQNAPITGMGFGYPLTPENMDVMLTVRVTEGEETRTIRLTPTSAIRPPPEYPPVRGL